MTQRNSDSNKDRVTADEAIVGLTAKVLSAKRHVITEASGPAIRAAIHEFTGIGDREKADRELMASQPRVEEKTNQSAETAMNAYRWLKGKPPVDVKSDEV